MNTHTVRLVIDSRSYQSSNTCNIISFFKTYTCLEVTQSILAGVGPVLLLDMCWLSLGLSIYVVAGAWHLSAFGNRVALLRVKISAVQVSSPFEGFLMLLHQDCLLGFKLFSLFYL